MENKIEVLKTASEYIVNLKISISKTAECLKSIQYEKGMAMIEPITEGLIWLLMVVQNTRDVQKGEISIEEINEKLNEIVEAMQNEDDILVADLFEYELLPIIENIENVINKSI